MCFSLFSLDLNSCQVPGSVLSSVQFSSVAQLCPTLCDPMNRTRQASLSITNSRNSLRLTSIESVMPSSHLILCRPLLLLPSIPLGVRNPSVLCSVAQSCLTLCDPMDCSLPGSSVHGIFQARILEWVSIPFSCHFLLQGIFLTQGSNPGLSHFLYWQAESSPLALPGNAAV